MTKKLDDVEAYIELVFAKLIKNAEKYDLRIDHLKRQLETLDLKIRRIDSGKDVLFSITERIDGTMDRLSERVEALEKRLDTSAPTKPAKPKSRTKTVA